MRDEERINPRHLVIRGLLRMAGSILFLVGFGLTILGFGNFISSFGSFGGPPRYFWCAFVGMPLMWLGSVLSGAGFLGAIARYKAGEIAPVGKDTFNYLADGTSPGVKTMASSLTAGIVDGLNRGPSSQVRCPGCGHLNDADARFCDECGDQIGQTLICPSCDEPNDHDAKFCKKCGEHLAANREE